MRSRYRWFVVFVFFLFMLLHQVDKLLVNPLVTPIMEEFQINEAQMGLVFSGAIFVAAILYPVWGYLYDRFARAKLLALASFIWGSTTWISALAPTFPLFVVTRASTGIDDSCYPGLYSLLSDYFGPRMRGKVYGLLQVAGPMGYMLGLILATTLGSLLGWRSVFFITGSVGILISALIFFSVREAKRGQAEPELADLGEISTYRIDRKVVVGLFHKPSLLLLFAQGFFGVFPWQVLTSWFFRYLEAERGYSSGEATIAMMVAILAMSAGYFIGGNLGDWFFKYTTRARPLVSAVAVLLGAAFLLIAMGIPVGNQSLFAVFLGLTGLFMPFASPNVTATVHDVTKPEVRSTALAVQYFIEQGGSAVAPALAGLIAVRASLHTAIIAICVSTWVVCAILFGFTAILVPRDIKKLRQAMRERAEQERAARVGLA